jgi:hypothetical protein
MKNLLTEEVFQNSVISSNIAEISYDDETEELDITFQNEAVYRYFYFPPYEFDRFIAADESYGLFFNAYIKNDYYYEKIKDWI